MDRGTSVNECESGHALEERSDELMFASHEAVVVDDGRPICREAFMVTEIVDEDDSGSWDLVRRIDDRGDKRKVLFACWRVSMENIRVCSDRDRDICST